MTSHWRWSWWMAGRRVSFWARWAYWYLLIFLSKCSYSYNFIYLFRLTMRPSVTWPRSRSLPTTTTGACHRRTSHCVYTSVTLYLNNNNLDIPYWPQVWNGQVLEHSLTERRRGRAGVHLELRGEGLPNIRNTISPGEERLWVGSLATRNTSQQVRQRLKKEYRECLDLDVFISFFFF